MKCSLIVAALFLAGVAGVFANEPKPVAVAAADKGKTITLKVGQEAVVSLKGNPTTGYSWDLAGIDGQAVKLDGEVKYKEDPKLQGMVGVPGMFHAKFKAAKPGKATVKLQYRRPWEKDVKPVETYEVSFSVEK
jgi:inhibitor of cysteine peptidase